MRLISPAWRQRVATAEDVRQFLVGSGFLMAHRVLRSFLDAQLVVAERLASSDPAASVESSAFLDECESVGKQMLCRAAFTDRSRCLESCSPPP
jgi:glycerol-3-phosphate O-acyltransferase